MSAEQERLREAARLHKHWRRWGPYLAERQWGTVREDYSPNGDAWNFFPFQDAHRRAYRWGEDGIAGISDNHQRVCFAVALWNGRDPILKERLFGLTNAQGNHGEDVKELYYYLDSTPTHSWMRCLYKYPQAPFPYDWLLAESARRGSNQPELELLDSGVFDGNRYFDVFVEYAKADEDDILIRITAHNRGPESASLYLLPTLWFRNRWSWDRRNRPRPKLWKAAENCVLLDERELGRLRFWLDGAPALLFTENETNTEALWGYPSGSSHYKDAFHEYVVSGKKTAVSAEAAGTKVCGVYSFAIEAGGNRAIRLRLSRGESLTGMDKDFVAVFAERAREADEFYALPDDGLSEDARNVRRQAFGGLLFSKQFYNYVVEDWLTGDPAGPEPPPERLNGRNSTWIHLYNEDIISMPDKWEYPWYASWDLAFHTIPLALIDPEFAKRQLSLLLREWYLHPNGQIPAYEWSFNDVNPPVHAWACFRVFKIDAKRTGTPDYDFLERVYHKLLMNFTWWVNRKDSAGENIFGGGFLGLDNIGVFDRNEQLPDGSRLEQSDATSWMAMYALNMLRIALELAQVRSVYEDIASKFFEHFLYIASAMNHLGGTGLWDEEDGFFYDRLRMPNGNSMPLRVRSMVGLIPLFAVETIDFSAMTRPLPGFERRTRWFSHQRPDLCQRIEVMRGSDRTSRALLALVSRNRLVRVLQTMLTESEFLSPYGIRSLSRYHLRAPYVLKTDGQVNRVDYEPGESTSRLFGGNSNWRGPIWFPVNYLLIEALQKFEHFYGDSLKTEFPAGSGNMLNLWEVASELSRRLSRIFLRDESGRRPCFGDSERMQTDPHFRDYLLFHEYFHGESGAGLGACHQTGWTALVAKLLEQSGG
jgi:hypothetical protein